MRDDTSPEVVVDGEAHAVGTSVVLAGAEGGGGPGVPLAPPRAQCVVIHHHADSSVARC